MLFKSALFAAIAGSCSGFAPAPTIRTSFSLRVSAPESPAAAAPAASAPTVATAQESPEESDAPRGYSAASERVPRGRYDDIDYSITLPFLPRPTYLDGTEPGDFGFDPLGFCAEDGFDLYYMRECELRHARLAMLAVVGWPLSELIGPKFMLQDGMAPSVLNGFNPASFLAVAAAFGAFGAFELSTAFRSNVNTRLGKIHMDDMAEATPGQGVAGDYDFDPAGLYTSLGDNWQGRKGLRELEITQGRWAMFGITAFAVLEKLTGKPIVEDSMFFHPNAALPILGFGYWIWSSIYTISPLPNPRIVYLQGGEETERVLKQIVKDVVNSDILSKGGEVLKKATEAGQKMMKDVQS